MKILHVIPAVAQRYGGPSRAILEMCRALADQGIDVLIATTDADGTGHLSVDLEHPVLFQQVPVIFFSRQYSESFKYSRALKRWLDKNIKNFHAVHIHALFSYSSVAAARICRRDGIPYVVRPLGSLAGWALGRKQMRKRILLKLWINEMLKCAAAIQYTSEGERRQAVEAIGLDHGTVIPLGVDEELLHSQLDSRIFRSQHAVPATNPYGLLLSRLHPVKRVEMLIDAFVSLRREQQFQHWYLLVAGDGEPEYVAKLKALARPAGKYIVFTGWLNGSERIAALRGASLLAQPSYQESFGLSAVEAMACRVPVLLSKDVNLSDEIEAAGAGWIVNLQKNHLLSVLREALADDKERIDRGFAGYSLVHSRFRWSVVASQLTNLYASILNQRQEQLSVL